MAGSTRPFKHRVYEQLARIGKAVASPQRLELLDLLSQGPRTVEHLAQEAQGRLARLRPPHQEEECEGTEQS